LSRDLPGTGSNPCECGLSGRPRGHGYDGFPADRGTSHAPTIKRGVRTTDARTQNAMSVSSSQRCSCTRRSRQRQTRLGCRPNVDDAEWAERHGCRESAVRTWMSVRRGPTERRRSAGTRRSRAKPGAKRFWLLLSLFTKVTRCKSGTIIRRYRRNGYSHRQKASLTLESFTYQASASETASHSRSDAPH
jgi:hypothetical protein